MIKGPLFSVLIAHFNNAKFFQQAYDSVLSQNYSNFEIIIVDDFSTIDEFESIKRICSDDNRVKIFRNRRNMGVGYTKRRLASLVNGYVFGFLDPDDALLPNALETVIALHLEYQNVGLVYSNFYWCDSALNIQSEHKAQQVSSLDDLSFYNFEGEISHFATFKKSYYEETVGIDTSLKIAEDKDIYMKMCELAPVKHVDKPLYLYRVHEGGISTNDNTTRALYWHWVALQKMAMRRDLDLENMFLEHWCLKFSHKMLKDNIARSRWIKLGKFFGLLKEF